MKEKKVLNGEQIRRREEKNFSLGLIIGLGLFIVLMLALNNNFGEWIPFSLNSKVLETPDVFKSKDDQGKDYTLMFNEYSEFIDEINKLDLNSLKSENFSDQKDYYSYSDSNYSYVAGSNYIKLIKDGNDVFYSVIENNVRSINLNKEKTYKLVISQSLITFKVNDLTYKVNVLEDGYSLETNYFNGSYLIKEERYDFNFKFKEVLAEYNKVNYIGYYVKDIKGYSLSDDRSEICNENNECELSTKYLEDGETIYYTVVDYFINQVYSIDMLLVKENEVFPFR